MLERQHSDIFLQKHWQRLPQFLPAALDTGLPQLNPDELAWLATLPDVESMLVVTVHEDADVRYRAETGPFDEAELSSLPDENWTLLVHDVEKHLPDFRSYFEQTYFIPDWRIDDLMVSCAAPGGSVGPHIDNYDVFLCQGEGIREWQIGDPGRAEADTNSTCLSLVKPFPVASSHRAECGDVLYLPPGVPHWGIASALCVTYSIGCRAPTRHELALGQERVLGKLAQEAPGTDDQVFYSDPDLSGFEARPGRIAPQTIQRIRDQCILDSSLTDVEIARVFGCVVTDPKAWLDPEAMDKPDLYRLLELPAGVNIHGMARIAWIESGDDRRVFVNGVDREIDGDQLGLVQKVCVERRLSTSMFEPGLSQRAGAELIEWFANEGLFDTGHMQE